MNMLNRGDTLFCHVEMPIRSLFGSKISCRQTCLYLFAILILNSDQASSLDDERAISKNLDKVTSTTEDYEYAVAQDVPPGLDPADYLRAFGYLASSKESENLPEWEAEKRFEKAVKSFQFAMGIRRTGKVDDLTFKYMKMPRCGNVDMEKPASSLDDEKRLVYVLNPDMSKLASQNITYRIVDYPKEYKRSRKSEINWIFQKAFNIWSMKIPLNFVRKQERNNTTGDDDDADIEIKFIQDTVSTKCDRCKLFSRSNSILAHAQYPAQGSGIYFNDLVEWSIDDKAKTGEKLLPVVLHQIGHALGLAHTKLPNSRMYPIFNSTSQKAGPLLSDFDIQGGQYIYGKRN